MPHIIQDLIAKKRDGNELSDDEIEWFVKSSANGTIQESQVAAMLMAMYLRNLKTREAIALTGQMMNSGEVLHWPKEWQGIVVDKHSTGGVGDKISLVLAPALAACGLKVPMISGRALGITGGTLDKLESIPGFTVDQSADSMTRILDECGCCIVGQTKTLVPADKIFYRLRDLTATVDSLPLIASSIVSKKAAESLNALVLDVKFGPAAFMKTEQEARELARAMIDTSNGLGVRTAAVLSRMSSPIGMRIGNPQEVIESVLCLKNEGPPAIMELVVNLGSLLLQSVGKAKSIEEGRSRIEQVIQDGMALAKFQQMIKLQGVSKDVAEALCADPEGSRVLPQAAFITDIASTETGYLKNIKALKVARLCLPHLKREVVLHCTIGDHVTTGSKLCTIHDHKQQISEEEKNNLVDAFSFVQERIQVVSLIKDIMQ